MRRMDALSAELGRCYPRHVREGWLAGVAVLAAASAGHAQDSKEKTPATESAAPRRLKRVEIGSFMLDVGVPLKRAAPAQRYDLPTVGLSAELLAGTRYWAAGGFLRWGVGSLDVEPSTQSGLVRTGPRLRIGTPVHDRYPSLVLSLSAGPGLAYAQNLERRPTAIDPTKKERTSGVAYFQLFAAPGLSVLVPIKTTKAGSQLWHIVLGANYYFTYWLTPEARQRELSQHWLECAVGFGGAFLP
jgi:hypothetical protein